MATPLITADNLLTTARSRLAQEQSERDLSIGEWADRFLMIPRGSGVTPHSSSLTPYWRHWHAIVRARITGTPTAHDPHAHLVSCIDLVTGTQLGKTHGFLSPALAWVAAVFPRDQAIILPSHDIAKKFAKQKIATVFERSPRLAGLLPHGQSEIQRRQGIKAWILDQSVIHFKNGAVAMDLRSDDLPLLLWDEFDALPVNVDGEGSPLVLGTDRQKTFPWDCLQARTTTCTMVDALGWSSLCSGTHERLHIACVKCGAHQWLDPDRIEPLRAGMSAEGIASEDAATWRCSHCGHRHLTDDVHQAVAAACAQLGRSAAGGWVPGGWIQNAEGSGSWAPAATFDADGKLAHVEPVRGAHRSGWMNSMYSRFITLGRFLAESMQADQGDENHRQGFINGWRAEPFVARSIAVAVDALTNIIVSGNDAYQHGVCPFPAWRVVLSCDQQGIVAEKSWFPYRVRAYAETGESWLVEAGTVHGFDGLERLAGKSWLIGQVARTAELICIDTANGSMVPEIRKWCAKQPKRRISISGSGSMQPDTPWSETRLTPKNAHRLYGLPVVWYYNSHLFRDELYEHLRGAPGRAKFNVPADAPEFYVKSLQSEERIEDISIIKGRHQRRNLWRPRQWRDDQGRIHTRNDNHWWDTEVQGLAAVTILGWFRAKPQTHTVSATDYVNGMRKRTP